jgi:hypothetical protein
VRFEYRRIARYGIRELLERGFYVLHVFASRDAPLKAGHP